MTTTIKIGRNVFRIPQVMINAKEIIDETSELYRIVVSNIGDDTPDKYKTLFTHLQGGDELINVKFTNGLYSITFTDALVTIYEYPYGTLVEFETDIIKETKKR